MYQPFTIYARTFVIFIYEKGKWRKETSGRWDQPGRDEYRKTARSSLSFFVEQRIRDCSFDRDKSYEIRDAFFWEVGIREFQEEEAETGKSIDRYCE